MNGVFLLGGKLVLLFARQRQQASMETGKEALITLHETVVSFGIEDNVKSMDRERIAAIWAGNQCWRIRDRSGCNSEKRLYVS
jgi:hypothetical protein